MTSSIKYAAFVSGVWKTESTLEVLVDKVISKYPGRVVEVFEMKPIGRYRRKIEVEKLPEGEIPEGDDEAEEDLDV